MRHQAEQFAVNGQDAFLVRPEATVAQKPMPWIWYAPTLPNLPGEEENWMFDRFLGNGIAVAGIDVGESYGSPGGTGLYSQLYGDLVEKRGWSDRPGLLGRSRGGLMLYNWAVVNPHRVACIAGIYPVCNLNSYPGPDEACHAYHLTSKALASQVIRHNPIDRLEPLARARVPVFHIHGDNDNVVPLEDNSLVLYQRYLALDGPMTLEVVSGGGHDMWPGWFESQALVDFMLKHVGRTEI